MATQVPYTGTPQVAAQNDATPYRSTNVPADAFGANVGAAISHLGDVEQKTGDELFTRAYAMEQLNQTAKANEASAQFTEDLGALHADISSRQGKDAVDYYPTYIQKVAEARQKYRDGLDTPLAQRMYDQESRNMQARAIWGPAGYVGQQQKAYLNNSSKAREDAAVNHALLSPEDEASFDASVGTVRKEALFRAGQQGLDKDAAVQAGDSAVSNLYTARIQGMAKSQPFAAQQLLDKAAKDGSLQGTDLVKLSDFVAKQRYNVGARQTANGILNGTDISFGAGIVEPARARQGISAVEGDYSSIGPTVTDKAGNNGNGLGKYQVMSYNLQPWLKEAGMPPMTQSQFMADHAAQDKLFDFKFGQYQQKYGSFNSAVQAWFGGEGNVGKNASDVNISTNEYIRRSNSALAKTASATELNGAADAAAKRQAPDDPMQSEYTQQHVQILHNRQRSAQREDEFNNRQTIEGALVEGQQNGQIPTTVEELTADDKTATAWNALKASDQRKYLGVLAKNAKGDQSWNPDSLKQYQQLTGMALDPTKSPEDIEKFLKTDMTTIDMPNSAKKEMIKLQERVFNRAWSNPNTDQAMRVLAPTLQQVGLIGPGIKKSDDYYQFTGALHNVIQDYITENKRMPKAEEIKTMGAGLLRDITVPGTLWNGTDKFFRADVPDEAKSAITQRYKEVHGVEPPEREIHSIYVAEQYRQTFGKKTQTPAVRPTPPSPQ